MIRKLLPDPILKTNAPPGLEVVLNRQKCGYVLHLINKYPGASGTYALEDHRLPMHDLEVSVNQSQIPTPTRIYLAPRRQEVNWSLQNGWMKISVPTFDTNALIVIEPSPDT